MTRLRTTALSAAAILITIFFRIFLCREALAQPFLTFEVKRPIGPGIGKYRLDWVFVKSFLKNPRGK